ncbi:MAG: nickel-binding protein [Acidimicrobiia bacterium]
MGLYMDRHDVAGATPEDLAKAHIQDIAIQERYGVKYLTYWFDPKAQTVFCLAEAPSAEAAQRVHAESHGLVANRIIDVDPTTVSGFLGAITESQPGDLIAETALRTILFTDMEGSTTLTQALGDARAMTVLRGHDAIIREALRATGGWEIKHTGDGIMASFSSVVRAAECAIRIQKAFAEHEVAELPDGIRVRIGLAAGEPVTEDEDLFGAAVQLSARICGAAEPRRILAASTVRELALGKNFEWEEPRHIDLRGFTDPVHVYELRWEARAGVG